MKKKEKEEMRGEERRDKDEGKIGKTRQKSSTEREANPDNIQGRRGIIHSQPVINRPAWRARSGGGLHVWGVGQNEESSRD